MASSTLPDLRRRGWLSDLFHGASLPFSAFGFIRRTPGLRRLSLLCAVVTAFALAAVLWVVGRYADDLLAILWPQPTTAWRYAWQLVRFLLIVVGAVVGANTVPLLLLAPLQDPLSETTERACGREVTGSFSALGLVRGVMASVAHTLQRIGLLLLGHGLLLLLHLIPGLGSLVWTVLATLWTAGWLAAEYLDVPMARHLYRFRQVRAILWDRVPLAVGFGLGLYVLLWVPVLNLFLVPVAVVAGTQLFCGLRAEGSLPPPERSVSAS